MSSALLLRRLIRSFFFWISFPQVSATPLYTLSEKSNRCSNPFFFPFSRGSEDEDEDAGDSPSSAFLLFFFAKPETISELSFSVYAFCLAGGIRVRNWIYAKCTFSSLLFNDISSICIFIFCFVFTPRQSNTGRYSLGVSIRSHRHPKIITTAATTTKRLSRSCSRFLFFSTAG